MAPHAKRLLTAEEFWALPEGEGKRELVRGVVVEEIVSQGVNLAADNHPNLQADTQRRIAGRLKSVGSQGYVESKAAFLLARAPDLLRLPDVCYVGPRKLEAGIPERYWETAPDLAVEVISPSETWEEVQQKVEEYLIAGTPMVWTVHPRTKRVVVYTPDAVARTYKAEDALEFPQLLPGFSCKVADFF